MLGSPSVSILDDAREGMNPDIRPQDDLFGHVNGRWLDTAEIPSDRSSWGPFVQLADTAEEQVHAIIEELAAAQPPVDTDGRQDRRALRLVHGHRADRRARRPPDPAGDRRARERCATSATSRRSSARSSGSAATACSAPTSTPTTATPTATSSTSSRAGSACPTSRTTARTSSPRSARSTSPTSSALLELAGQPTPRAPASAEKVLEMDTRLAAGHWERVETRDVQKTYNLHHRRRAARAGAVLRLGRLRPQPRRLRARRSPSSASGSRPTSRTSPRCSTSSTSTTGSAGC